MLTDLVPYFGRLWAAEDKYASIHTELQEAKNALNEKRIALIAERDALAGTWELYNWGGGYHLVAEQPTTDLREIMPYDNTYTHPTSTIEFPEGIYLQIKDGRYDLRFSDVRYENERDFAASLQKVRQFCTTYHIHTCLDDHNRKVAAQQIETWKRWTDETLRILAEFDQV